MVYFVVYSYCFDGRKFEEWFKDYSTALAYTYIFQDVYERQVIKKITILDSSTEVLYDSEPSEMTA